ncbi:MAG: zinc ribbon domain-containing protein [Halobacteriota archaeon]
MDNEKFCKNCGATNQPYAAFCADCGESFMPPATSPPEPSPPPQPEEPSGDEERGKYEGLKSTPPAPPSEEPLGGEPSHPSPPEEPSRRFKKRYILYGVLVLLLLSLVAGAISASQQTANRSVASPTTQASVAATTPTLQASASVAAPVAPSASPTSQPASSSLPDYASRLNTVGLGAGLITVSPFERVTTNGRQAYVGTLMKNGTTYNAQVYPMNSYSEALAFKDQLISAYKSQGYTAYTPGTAGDTSLNLWYGLSGQTLVGVSALPTSQIDTPITLVMTAV